MARAAPLTAGARIGRFVVVKPLGAGGMGAVYEARDPELARSVALKLLHEDDPDLAMRLLREAQALAQLQHPNVVAVHELDLHEDRVFIAMELVGGENLDRYLERTRPDWRGVVALFVQAGRGLAAAHAKGIVHRDVKPSNLFVDETGRVRVGDFGLARIAEERPTRGHRVPATDDAAEERPTRDGKGRHDAAAKRETITSDGEDDREVSAFADTRETPAGDGDRPGLLGSPLTRAGAVLGTPYFMAPEQHEGRRATQATDQFSLCVALWLALFDEHPFDGPAAGGLAAAVTRGQRRPLPPRRGVPRSVVRTIERGLATRAADRYPSMAALVAALEAHAARRRTALVLAGAGILVAGGVAVGAVALSGRGAGETCDAGGADRAWTLETRAAVGHRFASVRPATGADTAARAVTALDAYRDRWRAARADACTREPALRERTTQCLDRVAAQPAVVAGAFEQATGAVVDRAIDLVAGLPVPESCAAAATSTAMPLPSDPRVEAVTAVLARARVGQLSADRMRLRADLAQALKTAEELGHPGLLAEAHMLEAELAEELPRDQITQKLEAALGEAKRAGDRNLEADVMVRMLDRVTTDRNVQAIEAMLPLARAAAASSDSPRTKFRFAREEAESFTRLGRFADALKACDRIESLEEAPAVHAATCRCTTHLNAANTREAPRACRASLAAAEARYGVDAAGTLPELSNLSNVLHKLGEYDAARAMRERSLKLSAVMYAKDSEHMGIEHYSLGLLYADTGKYAEARREFERAVAIFSRGGRPTHRVATSHMQLAYLSDKQGDKAGAADQADLALKASEAALGPDHVDVVMQLLTQGNINLNAGRIEVALASFRRGSAMAARILGGTHMLVGAHLASEAQALLKQDKAREALAPAERAVSVLVAAEADARLVAGGRGVYAMALIEAGQLERARAELEKSIAIYKKLGAGSKGDLLKAERLLEKTRAK